MKRNVVVVFILLMSLVIASCSKNEQNEVDFSTWDDDKVYTFLHEVEQHVWKIPAESKSKEEIIKQYESYFTPELSEKIFNSLYNETGEGWKVPDGDAGYIFYVPGRESSEGNKVTISYEKDRIKIRESYKDGMYNAIEYTIQAKGGPIISDWVIE